MTADDRIRQAERAFETGTISRKAMLAIIDQVEAEDRRPTVASRPAPSPASRPSTKALTRPSTKAAPAELGRILTRLDGLTRALPSILADHR